MKRTTSFILVLIMVVSIVTAALAAGCSHNWDEKYVDSKRTAKIQSEYLQYGCSSFPHAHYHKRTAYYSDAHYECRKCHKTKVAPKCVETSAWQCVH